MLKPLDAFIYACNLRLGYAFQGARRAYAEATTRSNKASNRVIFGSMKKGNDTSPHEVVGMNYELLRVHSEHLNVDEFREFALIRGFSAFVFRIFALRVISVGPSSGRWRRPSGT